MATTYEQLKSITTNLNGYFAAVALFIANPASAVPSFEDYSDMSFDAILTDAIQAFDTAPSYALGATVDLCHIAMAINREFGMRAKTKAAYFLDAQVDANTSADLFIDLYARYLNYFRGTSQEENRTS